MKELIGGEGVTQTQVDVLFKPMHSPTLLYQALYWNPFHVSEAEAYLTCRA